MLEITLLKNYGTGDFMFNLELLYALPFRERFLWFLACSTTGWILTKLVMLIWERLLAPLVLKTESSLNDHLVKNILNQKLTSLTLTKLIVRHILK